MPHLVHHNTARERIEQLLADQHGVECVKEIMTILETAAVATGPAVSAKLAHMKNIKTTFGSDLFWDSMANDLGVAKYHVQHVIDRLDALLIEQGRFKAVK